MAHEPYQIPRGSIIHGYEFLEEIGSGGSAEVYKVRSIKFKVIYCAKVITISRENEKADLSKFETELQSLLHLDHPNIIRLYDYFQEGSSFFIILEYCSGGTLADEIAKTGGLSEQRFETISYQLLTAVAYAHANGIAHRDIKPANVLVDDFGRVKLADFGIASLKKDANFLSTNVKCSVMYAPPELLRRLPYDEKAADIWSLGMTLIECATGQAPFTGKTKDDVIKTILIGNFTVPAMKNTKMSMMLRKMTSLIPKERQMASDIIKQYFAKGVCPHVKSPQRYSLGILPPLTIIKKNKGKGLIRSAMFLEISKLEGKRRKSSMNFTFKDNA